MNREGKCEIYEEHIIRFASGNWRVRCWIPYTENLAKLKHAIINSMLLLHVAKEEVARHILTRYNVNAIEILENDDSGIVFYADWP